MDEHVTLCHRCEYRASINEGAAHCAPRAECLDRDKTVSSCYQYLPVRPVKIAPIAGEKRSLFLPALFAGRAEAAEKQPKLRLSVSIDGTSMLSHWVPVGKRKQKENRK